jgi:hypothetical protein
MEGRMGSNRVIAVAAAALAMPGAAGAQLLPNAKITPLKRVEPAVGDQGPMSTPGRMAPVDLRVNQGFEDVYSFDQTDEFGHMQTYYARRDGALIAVFPKAAYAESDKGLLAEIPAGTIWMLGDLSERAAKPGVARAYNALDLSAAADEARPAREPATPRPYDRPVASIWTSDEYRKQRLATLMGRVAR